MELAIFARAHAREGKEAEVARAIAAVVPETRKETGCLDIHAYRSLKDPRLFIIHSRWQSEAAFDLHVELPHTQRFVEAMEPLVDHDFVAERTGAFA